jgi:hypothetical protein
MILIWSSSTKWILMKITSMSQEKGVIEEIDIELLADFLIKIDRHNDN